MDKEQLDELRERKNKLIWERGSAKEIMRLGCIIYHESVKADPVGARVGLAVDHYSLIKRYRTGLKRLIGAWHFLRVLVLDLRVVEMGLSTMEQAEIVTKHLSKAPKSLGLQRNLIIPLLESWLEKGGERYPHTRPLMLVTLRDAYKRVGEREKARRTNKQVIDRIGDIEDERQLARICKEVGFFLWDEFGWGYDSEEKSLCFQLLRQGLILGRRVADDQAQDIIDGCSDRCIDL